MADYPYLPLWTDAYLADTRHLTAREHGAYLLLLMEAWRRPECALPDDAKTLARLAQIDPRAWPKIAGKVMAFWRLGDDGLWRQKKLSKVRGHVDGIKSKRSAAANVRWGRRRKNATKCAKNVDPSNSIFTDTNEPNPLNSIGADDANAVPSACKPDASIPKPKKNIPVGGPGGPSNVDGLSINKVIFRDCLRSLVKRGVPEETAREMLGKWKRDEGPIRVIEAVDALHKYDGQEPIPYIVAFFQDRPRRSRSGRDEVGL